jgi:hypothetical protein
MNEKKIKLNMSNYIDNIDENLRNKLSKISENKLYITEEMLKKHLTENEVLELIKKGVLDDSFLT